MKKPTAQQTWVTLVIAVLTVISGYLSIDKYGPQTSIITSTTTVIEATQAQRSAESIQRMIDDTVKSVMKRHEYGGDFH